MGGQQAGDCTGGSSRMAEGGSVYKGGFLSQAHLPHSGLTSTNSGVFREGGGATLVKVPEPSRACLLRSKSNRVAPGGDSLTLKKWPENSNGGSVVSWNRNQNLGLSQVNGLRWSSEDFPTKMSWVVQPCSAQRLCQQQSVRRW